MLIDQGKYKRWAIGEQNRLFSLKLLHNLEYHLIMTVYAAIPFFHFQSEIKNIGKITSL